MRSYPEPLANRRHAGGDGPPMAPVSPHGPMPASASGAATPWMPVRIPGPRRPPWSRTLPASSSWPRPDSTTARRCSAPSGAPGALRPDLPSLPRNPTARPCPGGGPPWGGPLPTAPTARLSCRRRLNLRIPDRSGLAQVLRALQHRPSIHSLPNSDYGSFYLPPSGSSSYWKRLWWCVLARTHLRMVRSRWTQGRRRGRAMFFSVDRAAAVLPCVVGTAG